uniref:Uncharacterized protein n=1 Tax=Panagrolaimus davidi TaxID=227884 RepID=A0A914Q249_9BILA
MTKEQLADGLSYPNDHLENLYYHYLQVTRDPMPQKLYFEYTKSKKIYDKICKSYENEEKWIKILASTFDDDFIKQNIETRIAEEFANKKLWKLYIRYLEDTKDVWILSVFCRYCNFFIEDLGMREKYLDKIEYYSIHKEPVSKWWIDVISFTYNHGTFEDMKEMIHKALSFISVDFSSLYEYLKNVVENILPKEMYQELRFEIHKTDIRVAKYEINEWSNYFPTAFLCEKVYVNMGKNVSDFAPTEIQSFDPTPQYFLLPKPLIRYIMNSPCNGFSIIRCQFLATANRELPQHVRQNKIGRFTFKFADGQLGIPTFIQFLKKNAAPLCKVKISFHETATQEYRNQIKAALNNCINEMPKFCGKKWITCKFIAS